MTFNKFCVLLTVLFSLLLSACGNVSTPETTAPSGIPTTVATEPTTVPTEPVPTVELHSGIREDGTFDEGTLFIGDSLTNGLIYSYLISNDLIGDAKYMAIVGASVQAYFEGPSLSPDLTCIFSPEFQNLTFSQAVEQTGREITAIYFMMGTNYSASTKASTYIKIIDHMLDHCPNATIYLQMIPYSLSNNVEYDTVNWIILETYGHYSMEGNHRVQMVDIKRAVGINFTEDGIHLNYEGQEAWYQALLDFAEGNNIPQ